MLIFTEILILGKGLPVTLIFGKHVHLPSLRSFSRQHETRGRPVRHCMFWNARLPSLYSFSGRPKAGRRKNGRTKVSSLLYDIGNVLEGTEVAVLPLSVSTWRDSQRSQRAQSACNKRIRYSPCLSRIFPIRNMPTVTKTVRQEKKNVWTFSPAKTSHSRRTSCKSIDVLLSIFKTGNIPQTAAWGISWPLEGNAWAGRWRLSSDLTIPDY